MRVKVRGDESERGWKCRGNESEEGMKVRV